jgi:hypothetical protein
LQEQIFERQPFICLLLSFIHKLIALKQEITSSSCYKEEQVVDGFNEVRKLLE